MNLPYTQSPSSSTHSSPRIYPQDIIHDIPNDIPHDLPQELVYPPIDHRNGGGLPPQYFDRSALSISTSNSGPHLQDPDEETAHPSRIPQRVPDIPSQPSSPPIQHPSSADAIEASFPGLTRPLTHQERELLAHLDRLKFFLATAPSRWSADALPASSDPSALPLGHPNSAHPALNRFLLPNSEYVSCVLWGGLYHITGTDIVRALVFRFEAFGRPVKNMKKFEEGVFSDLRNLKPGIDACLEEPKVHFCLYFKHIWSLTPVAVPVSRPALQVPVYSYTKETKGLLLVRYHPHRRRHHSLTRCARPGSPSHTTVSSSMPSNVTSNARK